MAKAGKASGGRQTGLRRVLGVPTLTLYGTGLILGAGIYSVVGAAAGAAGNGLWLAFLVAAAIALLTGLSYAELSTLHPRAAAEYEFARHAFPRSGPLPAATGTLLALSATATAATVATAFGGYLDHLAGLPAAGGAIGLLLLAAGVNLAGIRQAAWATAAMTVVEAAGLLLVIAVGLRSPGLGGSIGLAPPPALLAAAGLVFFAFLGFEDIANLAEEAREPRRMVPRAILLSVAVATVLYVLVAVAAVALAPPDELADSTAPLADAVAKADPRLGSVLAGVALFATANTCLAAMVA
ncbi:MAG TPA: APC family permease, partial [Candidatus Thermoplasmatota archaeon]|nr:APC family permease [Candidatus Thermoplasmatota archaeon]